MNESHLDVSSFRGFERLHAIDVYEGGFRVRAADVRDLARAVALSPYAMRHFLDEIGSGKQAAWIAERQDELVGIVLLRAEHEALAHVSFHLSYAIPEPHDVVMALALTASSSARDAGYLKLIIHTDLPADRLIEPLHDRGFMFSRARTIGGEPVLEFYRDIYGRIPSLPIASQPTGGGANPPASGDWQTR